MDILCCALALLGSVVGAGFASGREIVRFFAAHGAMGFVAVAFSLAALAALFLCLAERLSAAGQTGLPGLCASRFGARIGGVCTALFFLLSAVTGGAMLAACAELSALVWPIRPAYAAGFFITLPLAVWLAAHEARGLAAVGGALYAALNAAMMAGALPTLLTLSARKRRACVALLTLLFGLLLTLGMLVCQRHLQSVAMQPLPFVWLSRRLGSGGYLLVALCLYAAALSTLCAMLCAMANLLPRGLKTIARLILSALLCAALARVGFGRIVQSGYPILGALCAALLLLLALPARQDASISAR